MQYRWLYSHLYPIWDIFLFRKFKKKIFKMNLKIKWTFFVKQDVYIKKNVPSRDISRGSGGVHS